MDLINDFHLTQLKSSPVSVTGSVSSQSFDAAMCVQSNVVEPFHFLGCIWIVSDYCVWWCSTQVLLESWQRHLTILKSVINSG